MELHVSNAKMESGVKDALLALGVDLEALTSGPEGARVVVVQASMEEAVKALGRNSRDQVVMTRIDLETANALDMWVSAGIAKSRSEAAALFLHEGLKIRERELNELSGEIRDYEQARQRMRSKAEALLGAASKSSSSVDQ